MKNIKSGLFTLIVATILSACHTNRGREFNGDYQGDYLTRVAFPMGGIGAGMVCLEGNGCLSGVSVRNRPDIDNEPLAFAAISIKGLENGTKVLEGPVQKWKIWGQPNSAGGSDHWYGLPRFKNTSFLARFPFGTVKLEDLDIPMDIRIKGWSPFIPIDADNSSLPVAGLEYTFKNTSGKELEAVFSYNAKNFIAIPSRISGGNSIQPTDKGYIFRQEVILNKPNPDIYNTSLFYTKSGNATVKGLQGEYYPNRDFQGNPVLIRVNENINYTWSDAPVKGLKSTYYSIRWTGFIKVNSTGKYQVAVSGDDGYRLYINNKLLIDDWGDHAEETTIKVYEFEKNKEYPVKLEYYQANEGAAIRLGYTLFNGEANDLSSEGSFAIFTDEDSTKVDYSMFRGGWFDPQSVLWKDLVNQRMPTRAASENSSGASLFVPFKLKPNESKTIKVMYAWYVPNSDQRVGADIKEDDQAGKKSCCSDSSSCKEVCSKYYQPWYAGRFKDIQEVIKYWKNHYSQLKEKTELFTETFYSSTLPPEVIEAIAANLSILKSPTVLRQKDGRLWGWEGCYDKLGCCNGSCTHVWNYAQAFPFLFPDLERTLRETEFTVDQNSNGHQNFRASLPIRATDHNFHAAADGQLGGIMKIYREWRISGNTEWLKKLWPKVKQSFDYCSNLWDPKQKGVIEEPHHNTYDIEFWGPDGMCTGFYLGAMNALIRMGEDLGEDVSTYKILFEKGKKIIEADLYNGEYFFQKVEWEGLNAPNPAASIQWNVSYSDDAIAILKKEGPKYQYGTGCISDGVLSSWLSQMCGLGNFLDETKVKSHLESVYRYNFKKDLSEHVNPQRPGYAIGDEGGLLLCSWPKGGEPTLPFVYSNEVWTGIEYQVASHLMMMGEVEKGLDIVKETRKRYDGRTRNPFDEYECGHFYARAMSSYGLIRGLTGLFYDAVDKTLYIDSKIGADFEAFFTCNSGYGLAGLKNGKPFVKMKSGNITINKCMVSGKEMQMMPESILK